MTEGAVAFHDSHVVSLQPESPMKVKCNAGTKQCGTIRDFALGCGGGGSDLKGVIISI